MVARNPVANTVTRRRAVARTTAQKVSLLSYLVESKDAVKKIVCSAGIVVAIVGLQVNIRTTAVEVTTLQSQSAQLKKEIELLNVQVSQLRSPVRIQQIAEEQLGMVLPNSFVYSTKSTTTERDVPKTEKIID